MKKTNLFTVAVVIPALNEEKNIKNILSSVLNQQEDIFLLKEVVVISDASTDRTVERVSEIADSRISLKISNVRKGKAAQLGEYFKTIASDGVVILDADVVLASRDTLSSLIKPLLNDEKVGLVGGYNEPIKAKTFIQKSIRLSFDAYEKIGRNYKNGNNPHTCSGCILALSRNFVKSIRFPRNLFCDDTFLYFECISKGFKYNYVSRAKVYYKSAATLKEHISQNRRFVSVDPIIKRRYGGLFKAEYYIPPGLKFSILFREFSKKPAHAITIFLINQYCKITSKKNLNVTRGMWKTAKSTKEVISYE